MLRNYFLKRWFFIAALIGILLAIRAPEFSRGVFNYTDIRYISALGLFFMSISLATSRLWEAIRRPGPVIFALIVTWGLAPILGYCVGPLFLPPAYQDGLVIICCVPCTLASASVWTGMGGGNQAIALMMTMLTNSLVFIGTASWLAVLTGTHVHFDTGKMIGQLVIYVVVPIILAQSLRAIPIVGRAADGRKSTISFICRLCVLLIIVKSAVDTSTRLSDEGESCKPGMRLNWWRSCWSVPAFISFCYWRDILEPFDCLVEATRWPLELRGARKHSPSLPCWSISFTSTFLWRLCRCSFITCVS